MNKFPLGQVVATPGALEALADAGQTPTFFLNKHSSGDWGEVCDGDKRLTTRPWSMAGGCFRLIAPSAMNESGSSRKRPTTRGNVPQRHS